MSYKWLKWTRVVIALLIFLLTTLVFLDFRELFNEKAVSTIIWPQFVPSLLKFLTVLSISAIGFIVIILLTVLLGRIYCSAVCPLGIFQDFISRAGKYFKKKKKYKYARPHTILRNVILVLTILTGIFFSIFLVNLLDPYSLYGKMATGLFRPAGIWINNGIAHVLESMNIYYLYLLDINPVRILTLLLPILILAVLIYMAGKYGRLYCNTICPVGTLLGWISRSSLFRIVMDKNKCTQCGKCSFECKSQCISVKEMKVDNSRCVACYNCLTVCPDDAIHYTMNRKKVVIEEVSSTQNEGRKNFLMASVGAILAFSGFKKLHASGESPSDEDPINKNPTTVPVNKNSFVSAPGSLSVDHFNSLCTACQLCVSQCPTGVLQPSVSEFGITSFMQPFMDYNTNYCNFECTRCGDVCPTGAILKLGAEEKKTLQIGKVHFIKENCVVYTENTACGSCSEHCPTQAVRMVPYMGSLTIPETDNSICVGCGACEYACPVIPYKAIYVDGNLIHEVAQEPQQEKLESPDLEEDFPF